MYYNGKVCSLWDSTPPKIRIIMKKASNKSCSELNFTQKSPRARMSISPMSERGSKDQLLYIIRFQTYWSLESLAPLMGEIDIWARWLFCVKFNSEQHLFEAFFDVMCIFGSVEPHCEFNFPLLYIIRFQTYWSIEPLS